MRMPLARPAAVRTPASWRHARPCGGPRPKLTANRHRVSAPSPPPRRSLHTPRGTVLVSPSMGRNAMRFQDRAVLVTGGGSGIGQQVCLAAAQEGARVAVGDLDLERAEATAAEIRGAKGEAQAIQVDVADPGSAARFVEAAE